MRNTTKSINTQSLGLPGGFSLEVIEPRPGRWVITSVGACAAMEATHAELAAVASRHVERFGPEYTARLGPVKGVTLELDGGTKLVFISVAFTQTNDMVLAVVLPEEQEEAERAVGRLRKFLTKTRNRR